jgi:hypothetical protein
MTSTCSNWRKQGLKMPKAGAGRVRELLGHAQVEEAGWDIRFIFDYALRCHASYVNNKSAPIPEGTRQEIERFLRRLGYRTVIRSVEHAATASAGHATSIGIEWENTGVAPPYRMGKHGRGPTLSGRSSGDPPAPERRSGSAQRSRNGFLHPRLVAGHASHGFVPPDSVSAFRRALRSERWRPGSPRSTAGCPPG